MKHLAGWKIAVFTSGLGAVLFAALGGLSTGYSLRSIALLALAGGLLGAIAAPDIEPAAFRYATLWQMLFSLVGCLLIAVHFSAGPIGYLIAVVVGVVLGFLRRIGRSTLMCPDEPRKPIWSRRCDSDALAA
jgi:hypothetical protein